MASTYSLSLPFPFSHSPSSLYLIYLGAAAGGDKPAEGTDNAGASQQTPAPPNYDDVNKY